jgi:ParB/RepB/Spo0J family partition protein
MPNTLQQMLLLKIPIKRIRPNPHQPRRVMTQSAIDAMESSLREIGQQTPAKVRPLTEAEKAQDPDHDYELIGGHIRHAGALKAGLETLDCLVLNLTPDQAELAGLVDNQTTDMHWLDWVIAIEKRYNAQIEKSQRKIAVELGFTQPRINSALKVAKALTPASRALIDKLLITQGPEKVPAERAALALADLGDPKLVEKVLPVFLARRMNEPQAKGLANHVKAGNPPETYGKPNPVPKAPHPQTATAPAPTTATPPPSENKKSDSEDPPEWLTTIIGIGILWFFGWLAWKAVIWVITTIIHWF